MTKAKFAASAVTAGELGLNNAERNLRHYLGNSGKDLNVSPDVLLKDLSSLRNEVQMLIQNEATGAFQKITGASGEKAFTSRWNSFYALKELSQDWFFALGGFSCSVTGVVMKSGSGGSVRYRVHIFDRYNWDTGKSVDIGPIHIEDKELGALHLKGLAREYVVRGTSRVYEVNSWKPGVVIAPPRGGSRP